MVTLVSQIMLSLLTEVNRLFALSAFAYYSPSVQVSPGELQPKILVKRVY